MQVMRQNIICVLDKNTTLGGFLNLVLIMFGFGFFLS